MTLAFLIDYSVSGYWPKWVGLATYGVLIEIAQWFSGYRFFELSDIFADSLSIAIYLLARAQLMKIERLKTIRQTLDGAVTEQITQRNTV